MAEDCDVCGHQASAHNGPVALVTPDITEVRYPCKRWDCSCANYVSERVHVDGSPILYKSIPSDMPSATVRLHPDDIDAIAQRVLDKFSEVAP